MAPSEYSTTHLIIDIEPGACRVGDNACIHQKANKNNHCRPSSVIVRSCVDLGIDLILNRVCKLLLWCFFSSLFWNCSNAGSWKRIQAKPLICKKIHTAFYKQTMIFAHDLKLVHGWLDCGGHVAFASLPTLRQRERYQNSMRIPTADIIVNPVSRIEKLCERII